MNATHDFYFGLTVGIMVTAILFMCIFFYIQEMGKDVVLVNAYSGEAYMCKVRCNGRAVGTSKRLDGLKYRVVQGSLEVKR